MKNSAHTPEPEFSRPMAVDKIPANGLTLTLEPTEKQRIRLAERFALIDLPKIKAEVTVAPAERYDGYEMKGTLTADVVQQCVVTLEPLPAHIEHPVDVVFLKEGQAPEESESFELSHEDSDIEVISNGYIDLGEVLAQNLGIALDPYPRKADLPPVTKEYGSSPETQNPFAKLVELKKKPKDNG